MTKLDGDLDVFGDGPVTIVSTPGHTPGHQSLLLRLPHTGAVLLTGDLAHFRENWDTRRVPSINYDMAKTIASMDRAAQVLRTFNAQIWINHDRAQRDSLRMAPAFND